MVMYVQPALVNLILDSYKFLMISQVRKLQISLESANSHTHEIPFKRLRFFYKFPLFTFGPLDRDTE